MVYQEYYIQVYRLEKYYSYLFSITDNIALADWHAPPCDWLGLATGAQAYKSKWTKYFAFSTKRRKNNAAVIAPVSKPSQSQGGACQSARAMLSVIEKRYE